MSDDTRHQVNLLDFLAFLLRWRRLIIGATLIVTVFVVVLAFLLPERFESVASVRGQESTGQSLPMLLASGLGSLGGLANFATSLGNAPEALYIAILKSGWMSEQMIERFDLRSTYKMPTARPEDVFDALHARTWFEVDPMSKVVSVHVQDESPARAKLMAEYFVDQLDLRNQELKSLAARKERDFVGQRLEEERTKLAALEDSLYQFQVANGVLDIQEQTKATLQAAASLEAQRLIAVSELEVQRQVFGIVNPETEYTRLRLAGIDSSMQSLVRPTSKRGNDILVNLDEVPRFGLTYARLYRDIQIEQLIVGYLIQQFEQAKIEESRNTPTLVRIDDPVEASKRAWPRRSLMVIVAFAASLVFASAVALTIEMFSKAVSDPSHPQHDHVRGLMESWKTRR